MNTVIRVKLTKQLNYIQFDTKTHTKIGDLFFIEDGNRSYYFKVFDIDCSNDVFFVVKAKDLSGILNTIDNRDIIYNCIKKYNRNKNTT